MDIPATRVIITDRQSDHFEDIARKILAWGYLTQGRNVVEFEDTFAAVHCGPGSGHAAVATSSGTAALEVIFRSLGVAGREVVVPTNTFYATAAAVVHAGGRPIFCDIDPNAMVPTAELVNRCLTGKTAAVAYVHIGGCVHPHVNEIAALCRDTGLHLVEDCAHAHGCALDKRPAGTFGTAAAFSFYATKVITCGEGGMVLAADRDLLTRCRILRDHGKHPSDPYLHLVHGSNWRLPELSAALGTIQSRDLRATLFARELPFERYAGRLVNMKDWYMKWNLPQCRGNYYKVIAQPADQDRPFDRELVRRHLADKGVALSGEVFSRPLHRQPVFGGAWPTAAFPGADRFCDRHVCLPIWPGMTGDEVTKVCDALATSLQ